MPGWTQVIKNNKSKNPQRIGWEHLAKPVSTNKFIGSTIFELGRTCRLQITEKLLHISDKFLRRRPISYGYSLI